MMPAPIPANDDDRLAALRQLLILDTPPEARFDRIVAFAAQEFEVPTSLISLIDENRQWFKARCGMDVAETGRDISFCGHAIHSTELLVIKDATQDARFHDNPLVTAPGGIRFYAGAPLVMPSGHVLGTLCILGPQVRDFDAMDRTILSTLRDLCVEEILARQREGLPGLPEGGARA